MRANLENSLIYDSRFIATKLASQTWNMTGDLVLTSRHPTVLVFDLQGIDRSLYLPTLEERQYSIANVGVTGVLTVRNSFGVVQTTIPPGYIFTFFSTLTRWIWMGGFSGASDPTGVTDALRQITAAGTVTVSSTEAGVALLKSVASATPIALPTLASRNGKPIRIVDFNQTTSIANPITITPSGVEKIMNQASWEISGGDRGVSLSPQSFGWTIE